MAEEQLDAGTADESSSSDPFDGTPLEGMTEDTLEDDNDQDMTGEEEGETSDEEALIPFDQMPAEMKPHIARLTKLHQQKMSEIRQHQQKIDAYDRFMTDTDYQRQFLQAVAKNLGMTLQPADANGERGVSAEKGTDYTKLATEALADQPDFQAFAPVIAKVAARIAEAITDSKLAPIEERNVTAARQQKEAEYERMASELSTNHPGWEEYENDMASLWDFLETAAKGGPRTHPKYGNVLGMLHRLVAGDGQATLAAGQRMKQALSRRGTTSRGRQAASVNVEKLIKEATDPDSKWELAFNDALKRHVRK